MAALAAGVALLFVGRWTAMVLADRWWAEAVAPASAPFLTQWHLLELILELGGLLVAGAWCVGHFLWVVRSIGTVQVPRRLGDLEIRELMGGAVFRGAAIVAGLVVGLLLGAGGSRAAPLVAVAWQGARSGLADPVLGLDLGVYLAQLPLWDASLTFARHLVWAALLGAGLCHFAVGGLRTSRSGLAMTDAARLQLGLLLAAMLVLAAFGEALSPLRAVAGLDGTLLAQLAPAARWSVAAAWAVAAVAIAWWAFRPTPALILAGIVLWAGTGLLSHVVAPVISLRAPIPGPIARPIVAAATGLEAMVDETAPAGTDPGPVPGAGFWSGDALRHALETSDARLLAAQPQLLSHGGAMVPAQLAVRSVGANTELVVVAEDRLGPGGTPVSYREGDAADYPGIVSWRLLPPMTLRPLRADTVAPLGTGGIPLGGAGRRLLLAWGSQSAAALRGAAPNSALWWRLVPRERVARLFPPAWWDDARPFLLDGRLLWVVDGWFTAEGAALAPPFPWEGGTRRYARPGLLGVVDAATGETRFYLRPDADPVAHAWATLAGAMIEPADSLPAALRWGLPSDRWLSVRAVVVQKGPFGLTPPSGAERGEDLPRPSLAWDPSGPALQLPLGDLTAAGRFSGRIEALLIGGPGALRLIRWPEGMRPLRPRALGAFWQRFASFEQLQDSVVGAGGQLLEGPVRYEVGPKGTLAVRSHWALSAAGMPAFVWVELARGERLGAARTPATALANLRGESAPVVPAPDLPDPLREARRWAARADSALRSGDLEGFARAFQALKQVLGTP